MVGEAENFSGLKFSTPIILWSDGHSRTNELSARQQAFIRNLQTIMKALNHADGKGALFVQNL